MAKCPKCGKFTIPESVVGDSLAVIADLSINFGIEIGKSLITGKAVKASGPPTQIFTKDRKSIYCCSRCGYKWSK